MFRKLIATAPTWVTVPIRLALGLVFIAHGAQKVLGSFNGPGLSGFTSGSAPLGLRPAAFWLTAAALSEFIGGILVLLGLLTRVGAFFIAIVMLVAIIGVHWPNFFAQNRGFEYPLALLGMAIALVIAGGGRASVDEILQSSRRR